MVVVPNLVDAWRRVQVGPRPNFARLDPRYKTGLAADKSGRYRVEGDIGLEATRIRAQASHAKKERRPKKDQSQTSARNGEVQTSMARGFPLPTMVLPYLSPINVS